VFIARAMCGIEAKEDAMCSKSSLQVSRTVTSSFVWSWTIIVYEGIQDPRNWTQYSSFVLVFLCLCLIKSCTLHVGIIASVWGLPNSPSWLKFELRPSWNNIHDTFPPGPPRIQHVEESDVQLCTQSDVWFRNMPWGCLFLLLQEELYTMHPVNL
jgi:hypothetical protein